MVLDHWLLKHAIPTIFSRPTLQPLNRLLFRVSLSGMGINNYNGASLDERRALKRLGLRPEAVIFDVGANAGQFAGMTRSLFPSASIYSFEPNPVSFARLSAAGHSLAFPFGMGSTSGTFSLHDNGDGEGTATLVEGVHSSARVVPVSIRTVDDFCVEHGIGSIDLLKIDVEGFELEVLKGAKRMLAHTDVVHLEFNEMNLKSGATFEQIEGILDGFSVARVLYDGSLLPMQGAPSYRKNIFAYQNLIAVRRA